MTTATPSVNETTHPLYGAAVGYLASDNLATDNWRTIASFVDRMVKEGKGVNDVRKQFAIVEKQIKVDFKLTAMPPAWRSAKSTAIKAASKGVNLTDADGQPYGKTAVENAMRTARSGVKSSHATPAISVVAQINKVRGMLSALPPVSLEERAAITKEATALYQEATRLPIHA